MFNKINITKIVIDHLNTLRDYNTQKLRFTDYILFIFFPIILSAILVLFSLLIDKSFANILVTSLSIFAALLLNLLLLVFDIVRKTNDAITRSKEIKNPYANEQKRLVFLKEIYSNISYAIFVAILSIMILLIAYFICNVNLLKLASFLIYFFSINFILTLLMVVKRVHILLFNELKWKWSNQFSPVVSAFQCKI